MRKKKGLALLLSGILAVAVISPSAMADDESAGTEAEAAEEVSAEVETEEVLEISEPENSLEEEPEASDEDSAGADSDSGEESADEEVETEGLTETEELTIEDSEEDSGCDAGTFSSTTDSGITVTVSYAEGTFAETPELSAEDVSAEEAVSAVKEAVDGEVIDAAGVDIKFLAGGGEVQPEGSVDVEISLPDGLDMGEDDNASLELIHQHDSGETEIAECSATESGAVFTASEFSTWVLASVETLAESDAEELTNDGGELASGTYTLEEDVTLTTDITIPSGAEVTIDLNGHTLTGTGSGSVITVNGTLTVKDSAAGEIVSGSGSEELAGTTVNNEDGTWTTYWSVTDYDESGELAVTYYSYTSGAITGGAGNKESNSSSKYGGGVYVAEGASLTLTGGTITGNAASGGGGVYADDSSSFTMEGGSVSGNTATSYSGGVYMSGDGYNEGISTSTFTLSGGIISGNTAVGAGGVNVCFYTTFTMSGGYIANNTASSSYAGGVEADDSSSLTMSGGYITNNDAYKQGGGVCVFDNCSLIMTGGTISGNECTSSKSSSYAYGAGVYAAGIQVGSTKPASFSMSGGTIAGNETSGKYGGGVYIGASSTFSLSGSGLISDNESAQAGGGVYISNLLISGYEYSSFTMSGGSIKDNNTVYYGGGVYAGTSTTMTMSGGSIEDNTAVYYGGGVYTNGTFEMSGGSITSNACTAGTSSACGGGVFVYSSGTFTMRGGSIKEDSSYYGGGVYVYKTTFKMEEGSIADNTTTSHGGGVYNYSGEFTMSGGSITGNSSGGYGGGVRNASSGIFTMSGGEISNNRTSSYGGSGGGIFNAATFTMSGGSITGNTTMSYGGGICNTSTCTISGGSIKNNTCTDSTYGYGGGIYSQGTLTVEDCTIEGNSAGYSGGGVFIYSGTFKMSGDISITKNSAGTNGGGVFINNGSFEMSGGSIEANTAAYYGGGICNTSTCTISGGSIKDNTCTDSTYGYGGGIYSQGTLTVEDCTIEGNSAGLYGGGIYSQDDLSDTSNTNTAACTVTGCTVTFNRAEGENGYGGGLFISSGTFSTTAGSEDSADLENVSDDSSLTANSTDSEDTEGSDSSGTSVIANNRAGAGADDIYLSDQVTSIDLSGVDNLSTKYLADELGATIDGWYVDVHEEETNEGTDETTLLSDRYYTPAAEDTAASYYIEEVLVSDIETGNEYYLVAAHDLYTVTYYDGYSTDEDTGEVLNDGLGAVLSQTDDNVLGAAVPTISDPTRTGYRFLGWELVSATESEDSTEEESTDSSTEETSTLSLASLSTLAGSDGDTSNDTDSEESGDDSTGTTLYSSSDIANMTVTGDMDFVAQWSKTYTVSYDANSDGATGSTTDTETYMADDTVTVASNGYSLTGYKFTNWNTAADGTGTSYAADGTFMMTADLAGDDSVVVLYAQWEPISYAIAFDANAEDASGTMDDQSMTYDVAASLSANQFTRTGYTFAGWNTASDGSGTSYTDGKEVVNLTTTDGDEITLYAQWTEDTYTVTYTDGVDGEDVFEDAVYTITYTEKIAGEIPGFDPDGDGEGNTPERDGYTFAGWEESEDEDGNLTYTATWTEVVEDVEEETDDTGTNEEEEAEEEFAGEVTIETEAAESEAEEAETADQTQTGDSSSAGLWTMFILLAAAALAGILIRRRIVR